MKLFKVLLVMSMYFGGICASMKNLIINRSASDDSIILSNIISRYFKKYFSGDQYFLSIVIPSLHTTNNHYFDDICLNLFDDPIFSKFELNFLSELDSSDRIYKHAFNIMFIDTFRSLQ